VTGRAVDILPGWYTVSMATKRHWCKG